MGEDPLDDDGVIDRGHQLHPPGTARTAQDIQAEGPAHECRPHAAVGQEPEAVFGQRRPQHIAAQLFQPLPVVGGDPDVGVQIEPL